jgi:hypothetical protein
MGHGVGKKLLTGHPVIMVIVAVVETTGRAEMITVKDDVSKNMFLPAFMIMIEIMK